MRYSSAVASVLTSSCLLCSSVFVSNTSSSVCLAAFVQPSTITKNQSTTASSFATPAAFVKRGTSSSSGTSIDMSTSTSTDTATEKTDGSDGDGSILSSIKLDNSWIRQLSKETDENLKKSRSREGIPDIDDNRTKRPVYNGHYVMVPPTGLKEPRLLLYSKDVAHNLLKLSEEQTQSQDFVKYLSGNLRLQDESWATPYALSIMGTRYTNNCPYGTGNGYGDGRAISVGEFEGYELQLKGGGKTPFHRGADGRAVLRSSIREFLASEAMHHMRVPTTRALSLIVSEKDSIYRPWYSDDNVLKLPSIDDPRLAAYGDEKKRKQVINQIRSQTKNDPNIMINEPCAITCRVAPSFMRVGHIDLFARRIDETSRTEDGGYDTSTLQWIELEELIWHACYREFKTEAYDPYHEKNDIVKAADVLLTETANNLSTMVGEWIRVGFAQGNFNADNCLISGRTMDYGPFGFMEEYNPLFAKWTGSGQHFGFMNQPNAGYANFHVLVSSVVPVMAAYKLKEEGVEITQDVVEAMETEITNKFMTLARDLFEQKVDHTFRQKMGFLKDEDVADDLFEKIEPLLRKSRTDWTVFWRQLTYVMKQYPDITKDNTEDEIEEMMKVLEDDGEDGEHSIRSPFYEPLAPEVRGEWIAWIKDWRTALQTTSIPEDTDGTKVVFERMKLMNPKYVLREWMLVDAYRESTMDVSSQNDNAILNELYELIQHPYEEGTEQESSKYYRRASDNALTTGGTAFMS